MRRFGLIGKIKEAYKLEFKLEHKRKRSQGTKVIKAAKVITTEQFGKTVNVYNGKRFLPIAITAQKVGYKYKDFILTKRQGGNIHKKKLKVK